MSKENNISQYKQELVTVEYAQDLLKLVAHPKQKALQRPLSKEHIAKLIRAIKAGNFLDVSPIHLIFCEEDQLTYLVNGQHTLNAIVQSRTSISLTIRQDSYPTLNEVRLAYMVTDHSKVRRPQDTHRAFNLHNELGLSLSEMDYISAAIKFLNYNFRHNGGYIDDLAMGHTISLYAEPFKLFKECNAKGESKIVRRLYNRGYLSIILLTFKFEPEKAKDFWKMVCHGNYSGSRFHPASVFRDKIREYATTGGWSGSGKIFVTPGVLSRIAASAWTAYIEGREIKSFRIPEQVILKNIPIGLAQKEIKQILDGDEASINVTDFSKIEFQPKPHIYRYEGENLTSVTKFVASLYPPFDRQGIAEKKAKDLGIAIQQVLGNWNEAAKKGRELGTTVHEYIQQKLNGIAIDELRYRLNGSIPLEFDAFDKYYNRIRQEGMRPIWIEKIIGDISYNPKLAGTVDCLFSHPKDGYILIDWKTGKIEEWNTQKFNPPFEKVPCDDLYKYSFQLSLYKLIIERNTDINISKMYIVHLFGDEYEIYPAIDYSFDLDHYLKSIR